ncbi:MAG: GNAT family N-acetyltransferase, partial [Flavobacteriales bacterium]
MEEIKWVIKHFDELSALEYHRVLYLRTEIFVVEQNCPYQEVDHKDLVAYHVFGLNEQNELVAVARILPENVSYKEVSIGRVAVKKNYRGTGLADKLMDVTFSAIYQLFGKKNIRISAQEY